VCAEWLHGVMGTACQGRCDGLRTRLRPRRIEKHGLTLNCYERKKKSVQAVMKTVNKSRGEECG
jgi:hypothetical protein